MNLGFIKKYSHIYIKQIKWLDGILNGIEVSLVNLQNTNLINIMIGIVIVGTNPTINQTRQNMV
jgi:hypothetical protein